MSKEKSSSPESSGTPSGDAVGKRRPTKPHSKKSAKSAKSPQEAPEEPAVEKSAPAYPVFDLAESSPGDGISEPAAPGESSSQQSLKRNKRRRKKGKGGGSQATLPEAAPESGEEKMAPAPLPARQTRPKLDHDAIAKLAWKIYLAEVSEEGVALIGDNDARELSRRCFRLAEIFMEEQSRHP